MSEVFFKNYLKLIQKRISFATAIVVKYDVPISGKSGDKAIIKKDGSLIGWIGGGCTNSIVIKESLDSLSSGKPKLIVIDPKNSLENNPGEKRFKMTCHSGGSLSVYVEPVFPKPLIVVLGNSPVASSLLKISLELGYETIWSNKSKKKEGEVEVDKIIKNFNLKDINLSKPSFIIICTQGENDDEALKSALKTSVDYVAFVGSKRKTEILKKELFENGVSQERLDSIVNPAGLNLNARTPEEIALSIIAEIVQILRSDEKPRLDTKFESVDKSIDPVCGMVVNPQSTKFTLQFKKKNFYFCCNGCRSKFKKEPEKFLLVNLNQF